MNSSGLFIVNMTLILYILKLLHVLLVKPKFGRSNLLPIKHWYARGCDIASEGSLRFEIDKYAKRVESSRIESNRVESNRIESGRVKAK
jgi:hypothetical protein